MWASYHHKNGPYRKAKQTVNIEVLYNMPTNKVSLHRVLAAPPEKVFHALKRPALWLSPYGFTFTLHEMNATVGGTYCMSLHNLSTGDGYSFGGKYVEIKPAEFLKYTDQFDNPNLPG